MNKIIILFFLLTCILQDIKSDSISVCVQPISSSSEIILRSNREKSEIFMIQFPLAYRICNLSSVQAALYHYGYYFNNADKSRIEELGWMGQGVLIFKNVNGKLHNPYHAGRIIINPNECCEYVTYTYHLIGKQGNYQDKFSHYLSRMKEENKDTLNIGTLKKIEEIYPQIFKDFLEGDSIEFYFWKIYKEGKEKHIVLPIKFQ